MQVFGELPDLAMRAAAETGRIEDDRVIARLRRSSRLANFTASSAIQRMGASTMRQSFRVRRPQATTFRAAST